MVLSGGFWPEKLGSTWPTFSYGGGRGGSRSRLCHMTHCSCCGTGSFGPSCFLPISRECRTSLQKEVGCLVTAAPSSLSPFCPPFPFWWACKRPACLPFPCWVLLPNFPALLILFSLCCAAGCFAGRSWAPDKGTHFHFPS